MNASCIIAIFASLAMLSCNSVHGLTVDKNIRQELEFRIKEGKKIGLKENPREGDVSAVVETMKIGGKDEAWAVLQMAKWDRRCEIRMQWWISTDHINRILILACIFKNIKEEDYGSIVKEYQQFSVRFSEKESKLRLSEIEFVVDLLSKNELITSLPSHGP
jgi:hypothetical protein